MKISLASPVYNEGKKIQEFIERADKTLKKITNDYEIVLVNDASPDDTLLRIKEVLSLYPRVKLISLTKNSGQHIASTIALKHTTGDYVFLMDSDLQVNPESIEELFSIMKININCDVVSACRISRSNSITRRVGSFVISFLANLIANRKTNLKDPGSSFKLFTRRTLDKLFENDILIQNYPILMLNLNLKIIEYPIHYNTKGIRRSNYRMVDLISILMLALLNFSTGTKTLFTMLLIGVFLGLVSSIGFCYTVLVGIFTQSPLPTNIIIFLMSLMVISIQLNLMSMIVFKLERINKNLDFRRSINQRIEYEN